MNDYREIQYGIDFINQFINIEEKGKKLRETLDYIFNGTEVNPQEILNVHNWWREDWLRFTYITCFSECEDFNDNVNVYDGDLAMWRGYGSQNDKIMLSFCKEIFFDEKIDDHIHAYPVLYCDYDSFLDIMNKAVKKLDKYKDEFRNYAGVSGEKSIELRNRICGFLHRLCFTVKHSGFSGENFVLYYLDATYYKGVFAFRKGWE